MIIAIAVYLWAKWNQYKWIAGKYLKIETITTIIYNTNTFHITYQLLVYPFFQNSNLRIVRGLSSKERKIVKNVGKQHKTGVKTQNMA